MAPLPCRDINLRNIVLKASYKDGESTMVAKLCDFGYCNSDYGSAITSAVSTPAFIAPEVVDPRHAIYDAKKADLWSAGVILYFMIAGRFPFGTEQSNGSINVLFKRIVSLALDPPQHMSFGARELLQGIFRPTSTRVTIQQIIEHWWVKDGKSSEPGEAPTLQREAGFLAKKDLNGILDRAETLESWTETSVGSGGMRGSNSEPLASTSWCVRGKGGRNMLSKLNFRSYSVTGVGRGSRGFISNCANA